jgi:hypothetical protein
MERYVQGCGSASLNADPDPTLTYVRIRVELLLKVIEICDRWSVALPWLHFESAGLHIVSVHGSILSLYSF